MKKEDLGFLPLGSRILVKKYVPEVKEEFKQSGGLYIPEEHDVNEDFKKNSGEVLSLGTGCSLDLIENIKVGSYITFNNPHSITYKEVEYYLIHEDNIELIVDHN